MLRKSLNKLRTTFHLSPPIETRNLSESMTTMNNRNVLKANERLYRVHGSGSELWLSIEAKNCFQYFWAGLAVVKIFHLENQL